MTAGNQLKSCLGLLRVPLYQNLCLRNCSQKAKNMFISENSDFPSIKIKGSNSFGDFANCPNYNAIASLILKGKIHAPEVEAEVNADEIVEGIN